MIIKCNITSPHYLMMEILELLVVILKQIQCFHEAWQHMVTISNLLPASPLVLLVKKRCRRLQIEIMGPQDTATIVSMRICCKYLSLSTVIRLNSFWRMVISEDHLYFIIFHSQYLLTIVWLIELSGLSSRTVDNI